MRILAAFWLLLCGLVFGNDGSAEATPVGGIRLKREARISMEKERLTIGRDRVTVEYEFLNTTNQDITVEIAFPIPPFGWAYLLSPSVHGDLEGWHVWVEGKELKYQTEVKASAERAPDLPGLPDSVDQAPLLRRMSIDIESFGQFHPEAASDRRSLQKSVRRRAAKLPIVIVWLDETFQTLL
jgi:hypothetical protein